METFRHRSKKEKRDEDDARVRTELTELICVQLVLLLVQLAHQLLDAVEEVLVALFLLDELLQQRLALRAQLGHALYASAARARGRALFYLTLLKG